MKNILVLNSGSSSLKYQLINSKTEQPLMKGHVDGIGLDSCVIKYVIDGKETEKKERIENHEAAVQKALVSVEEVAPLNSIQAVGHRVVHGGEYYTTAVKITKAVMNKIEALSGLAPLHNPPNLAGIKACKKVLPKTPQVAVFDTAFHQTLPPEAYMYGIPYAYYKKYSIRKYGFHGTSHKYIMQQTSKLLKKKNINMISCHIGNGSSVTAIKNGISIDTSMGFTPLPGLIMGTRSGDIDPEIMSFIEEKENLTTAEVKSLLNKKSGLLGISGSSDMRVIHKKALKGDKKSQLAINILAYDVAQYIGAYAGIIGPIDAIVFTAGLGEKAYYLREKIIKYFNGRNIHLDKKKNKDNELIISTPESVAKVLVMSTNEELMIAQETKKIIKKK